MLLVGLTVRLAPLTSDQRTIAAISEDGYLMLTVARNVALGRSLTIAEGTIATNGVQPLVTYLWAGLHWLRGSQRMATLRSVVVVQLVIAIVTAILVALLAREAFRTHPWRDVGALLAGSLWFGSPLTLRHTTNGLETGVYACFIATVLLVDAKWRERSFVRAAVLGVLLGTVFLVRVDAVFFIAVFLLLDWAGTSSGRRRLTHSVVSALFALAVASPWLIYNARMFGHIVPVSGRAQNLNAQFAENLPAVPRVLAEYVWMATPLPAILADGWLAALLTTVALSAFVVITILRMRRLGLRLERWMTLVIVPAALLAAYYGIFFGAAYFLSRYLFPIALMSVLLPVVWVMPDAHGSDRPPAFRSLLITAALTVLVGVSAQRLYARSAQHDHAQVVQWVAEHLTAGTWVGAPQSGTLGYFHERTINLDGKVNPQALQARRDNRLFAYVVRDTPIEYIADWYGLARWVDHPETVREEQDATLLQRFFAVVVRDPARNLVVLRRKDRPATMPQPAPAQ